MTESVTSLVTDSSNLIRVLTDEFNLSLRDIRAVHREIIWGTHVTEECIMELGYAVVQPRPPVGEGNFIEITPVLEDGLYYQNWVLKVLTPEEIEQKLQHDKATALVVVKDYVSQSIDRGAGFNFGTEEAPNVLSVQIRDQDRLNILGMSVMGKRNPEMVQLFRTAENVMVTVTGEQMIEMSDLAYKAYVAIKGAEWALIDQIQSADSVEAFPELPTSVRQFYETNAGLPWVEQTA